MNNVPGSLLFIYFNLEILLKITFSLEILDIRGAYDKFPDFFRMSI